jgi:hypothetical protein
MVQRALVLLCVGCMAVFMSSCGQTYELQSITVASTLTGVPTTNLEGIGASDSFIVTAHYSNTKSEVVTVHSNFQLGSSTDALAPLDAVTLSRSGVAQAVISPSKGVGACTWHATPTNSTDTLFGYTTEPYPVTVTYQGFSATGYINVASAGACYDGQEFIAPAGFTGN